MPIKGIVLIIIIAVVFASLFHEDIYKTVSGIFKEQNQEKKDNTEDKK